MQLVAEKTSGRRKLSETEQLIIKLAFSVEYLVRWTGGIQMNQGEILRLQRSRRSTEDQTAFNERWHHCIAKAGQYAKPHAHVLLN